MHLPWSLWRPRKDCLWVGIHLYRHTFCYICIENWANLKKNCPLCKQSIKKRKLEKDLIAFNIIDDLQSKCMHENCHWEGAYSQLKKHQRWCEFKPNKTNRIHNRWSTLLIFYIEVIKINFQKLLSFIARNKQLRAYHLSLDDYFYY